LKKKKKRKKRKKEEEKAERKQIEKEEEMKNEEKEEKSKTPPNEPVQEFKRAAGEIDNGSSTPVAQASKALRELEEQRKAQQKR